IGLVFFAIGYTGLGMTTDPLTAWLLIGAYGLFTGCTDGVGKAWISSLVADDIQGSAQGVFQGLSGFAVLAAGIWAGLLWGADGQLPLLISGIAGGVVAAVVLMIAIIGRYRASTSRSANANGGAPAPATE
ncbi:MAG: MFS transporter, partial [Mycobacterium sp.]